MNAGVELRNARRAGGLTQAELADRTSTSQATISAYESGAKQPSVDTLSRLLSATGARLAVVRDAPAVREPTRAELARAGRTLVDVLDLAGALPVRHSPELRFPGAGGRHEAMTLAERIVALHRALSRRRIPHAFGGAIALAFATRDPRGTSDIDINLFVPAGDADRALRALPDGVARPQDAAATIERDGQTRLWWDDTPLDLFFDYAPIHADAAAHRRTVPFAGTRIPVLGPVELAVFKAMFDRTRDWADIEAMIAADALDLDAVRTSLQTMLDPTDTRFRRLESAERVARDTT